MNDARPAPLADFAVHPHRSRGRVHDEPAAAGHDPFALDRRRVLHSTALRRLEYKTQVFVSPRHDHFRTRLTHTLEVVDVARRLATALGANETLAETIALAHDLGHPPFGHAGEVALNELMREHGGFEHNTHSLRIVDQLEHPFPEFHGLNLTFETREGLAKHETAYDAPGSSTTTEPALQEFKSLGPHPTAEAQIASLADRLAYDSHDLEDAIGAGLIDEADLKGIEAWEIAAAPIRTRYPDLQLAAIRRPILDELLRQAVDDAVAESARRVQEAHARSPDDVRQAAEPVIRLSPAMQARLNQLEGFLLDRVYRHERLAAMDAEGARIIREVFLAFIGRPEALPPRFRDRVPSSSIHRVVCDYVAGMTDRFCRAEWSRLAHGNPSSDSG